MTQHASAHPPSSSAPEPSHAERVKTLLTNERVGTIATLSARHPGWPFASVMPYALAEEGFPLFLISGMAIHTQNALADARARLLVMQSGGDADPLGSPRATLLGHVRKIDAPSDAERSAYLDRHPMSRHWIGYSDFAFYRLDVTTIYFVGGFGVMGGVESSDYVAAEPDPLAASAAQIIEHMNRDHADSVVAITRHFGGLPAEEAVMVACDRLGFVVRARLAEGMKGVRIAFPESVTSTEDARRVLVTMSKASKK
jgi:putative heme iron utilization protein